MSHYPRSDYFSVKSRAGSVCAGPSEEVICLPRERHLLSGGASVLVNGAVFKTVSEPARAGSGRFDSYTPPPIHSDLTNAGNLE